MNLRVKWDPDLMDIQDKATANHGGDIMPVKAAEQDDILEDSGESPEVYVPPATSDPNNDESILKSDYVNPGLETTTLYSPKDTGISTRSKGKLKLDNDAIPLDESIETFVRKKGIGRPNISMIISQERVIMYQWINPEGLKG